MFGYLLASFPSALLLFAAFLLALYPQWVSDLQSRKPLRYAIAGALGLLAVVTWVLTAMQTHNSDIAFDRLNSEQRSDFQSLNEHIAAFESHTQAVPQLALHFSNENFAALPMSGGLVIGLNVTITNDGDDATYNIHYVSGFSKTPDDAGLDQILSHIRTNIVRLSTADTNRTATIRRGESQVTSAVFHLQSIADLNALSIGLDTAYFGIAYNVKDALIYSRALS